MSALLIVDDEKSIREALQFSLEQANYHVSTAESVAAARAVLQATAVDLLILDIGLPDGNGLDFLKELRQRFSFPVLILSARGAELDRVLGLEMGADDYVVKPFSPREVAARVKAILKRTQPEAMPAFEHDANKQAFKYFGQKLSLTRYEYLLLKLFVDRPGWVYSRQKIMDLIWADPAESYDRTIDTHIKTLRSKLKAIRPDLDPIETRRGQGYALKEYL
ncbi:MAG: response regulator [Leptospiraceae bacterium]|nr:response regulator [Leptospiraceae bacterium]